MTCHVPHIWITELISIITQLQRKLTFLCFLLLSQALSWAPDLRRPSQHSASHLSDRCLPPKQWIITALHLSGCTHLVWSAAFLLLFLVMAWHPQSAYQAPFFWTWHEDALSLSGSVSFCLFLFPAWLFFFFISFSLLLLCSVSLTQTPQSNEQADYVREKREPKKKENKRMFCHQGNNGRSNLSSSLLASWLNVYPPRGVVFFLLLFSVFFGAYFHHSFSA